MEWKVLAGVRFLLAWIVFCGHLRWFVPAESSILLKIFGDLDGFTAVLGFLLISGYSIGHSIARQPQGFYQRRLLRLYPLYALAIVASLLPFAVLGSSIQSIAAPQTFLMPRLKEVVGNLLFLQGFTVDPIASNPIVWTLSVEVLCYVLAPLFIKMSSRLLLAFIAISAIAFAFYPYLHDHYNLAYYSHLKYGLGFLLLLWAWLLGFLYARDQGSKLFKGLILGLGVVLARINGYSPIFSPFTYASTALVVMYARFIKLPATVLNGLNYLGDLSYPLYLFHVSALIFAACVLHIRGEFKLAGFTLLVSMAAYHLVDVPLRVRKRLNRVPSSTT